MIAFLWDTIKQTNAWKYIYTEQHFFVFLLGVWTNSFRLVPSFEKATYSWSWLKQGDSKSIPAALFLLTIAYRNPRSTRASSVVVSYSRPTRSWKKISNSAAEGNELVQLSQTVANPTLLSSWGVAIYRQYNMHCIRSTYLFDVKI